MRFIKLVIKSVGELARNNKLSVIVVVIGLILSANGFYFFVGFGQGILFNNINSIPMNRTYSVSGLNNQDYLSMINSLSKNNEYDIIDMRLITSDIEIDGKSARIAASSTNKINGLFAGYSHSMSFDRNSSEPVCIISKNLKDANNNIRETGSFITIGDIQYKIIGMLDYDENDYELETINSSNKTSNMTILKSYVYIPMEQMKQLNMEITTLKIKTGRMLDNASFKKLSGYISDTYNKVALEKPVNLGITTSDMTVSMYQNIAMYLLICAVSIINSLMLLKFWFDKNKKENLCYMICGSSHLKLFAIMFSELIILVISSVILSLVFFETVIKKIILANDVEFVMGTGEYAVSCVMFLAVASVALIIMILRELKNEYEWRASE